MEELEAVVNENCKLKEIMQISYLYLFQVYEQVSNEVCWISLICDLSFMYVPVQTNEIYGIGNY